jgi:hypothetical protein
MIPSLSKQLSETNTFDWCMVPSMMTLTPVTNYNNSCFWATMLFLKAQDHF